MFYRLLAVLAMFGLVACDDDEATGIVRLDISVCAPDNGPFTLAIDNRYMPLPVGRVLVLEGEDEDEGTIVRVEMTVLDETEVVAGVVTRVVEVLEYEDDELIEISRDFYAQAPDGTVCYFGEDVDVYEDGELVGHPGQWRAGEGANLPGILMPGTLRVDTEFAQEYAPDVAEDMSAVVDIGLAEQVPAGTFADCAHLIDWNPLEGDTRLDAEDKFYARGVGIIIDDIVELVSYQSP